MISTFLVAANLNKNGMEISAPYNNDSPSHPESWAGGVEINLNQYGPSSLKK
jgi:hypothetical protein